MNFLDKNLEILAKCLQDNTYKHLETDRFELKNLATGWGEDFYKTVCAFLNTNGGIIVIGINDNDNAKPPYYKLTGYDNSKSNENHLKQELPKKFTDNNNNPIDITDALQLKTPLFMDKHLAIIYVEELNAANKYAFYKGKAYERKLTGDHEISEQKIATYEETKRDIIQYQELAIVNNTQLDNIDLDTLNHVIFEYNRGKKRGETLKKNKKEAKAFLLHQGFMRDEQLTILGMLVCGSQPQDYIQGKCEADCYVVLPNAPNVVQSKEVIEDNIIELIRQSQNFVWRNMQVGIGYTNGGIALPEYPETLIRECINNAFAHRDYSTNRFVIIEIHPQKKLLIRNPGMFERRQRISINTAFGNIRRIIPFQVARNPKLAHLLKSFNYWEGRGTGLSALIDACLDNEIDVPYYTLSMGDIKLHIPKGKVFDHQSQLWLDSFAGYIQRKINRELSQEEKILLAFFRKSELLNQTEQYTILITTDNNHTEQINALFKKDLIFINPESPELYPIYQVDTTLMKTDFIPELLQYFGTDWQQLKFESQEILQAIYQYNTFAAANEIVSANSIGTHLYLKKTPKVVEQNDFDNYKRKIRNLFNQLESKHFIVRKDGKTKEAGGKPDFKINEHYLNEQNLFNL